MEESSDPEPGTICRAGQSSGGLDIANENGCIDGLLVPVRAEFPGQRGDIGQRMPQRVPACDGDIVDVHPR